MVSGRQDPIFRFWCSGRITSICIHQQSDGPPGRPAYLGVLDRGGVEEAVTLRFLTDLALVELAADPGKSTFTSGYSSSTPRFLHIKQLFAALPAMCISMRYRPVLRRFNPSQNDLDRSKQIFDHQKDINMVDLEHG